MQRFVPIDDVFKGRHFDGQIIILCVTWYTSFKLSLRDLVIMMADRGISVTHTTILRWIQLSLPKTPAGHPNPFDQLILAEAGVLTDSPSYHGN